jgi:hypothetical protein
MPRGICKLCLLPKDLQDSHLIPAAMYKYIRDPSKKNPNPVVVGRKVTATTSKQVTDYLLCAECEDHFNKNGENGMLKWVWNGTRFPLGDRLAVAHQHYTFSNFLAFSGSSMGVNTDELAYFALSIIWRAAVHQWDTPFGGKTHQLNLGAVEETIRQYLHGEAAFPVDVVVVATVCTDPGSIQVFYLPSPVSRIPGTSFSMLTLSVHFMVFIGSNMPPVMREMCCVKSTPKLIFQRDCSQKTEAFAQIMETSKPSKAIE